MLSKEFVVKNPIGLHARPAAIFVQECHRFKSEIEIQKDFAKVNAKSIIGVMSLAASDGDKVMIAIEGVDEAKAMEKMEKFFEEEISHL